VLLLLLLPGQLLQLPVPLTEQLALQLTLVHLQQGTWPVLPPGVLVVLL
jgi:hypothetical protein